MTKQEADEIMKITGNIRGSIIQTHAVYVRHRKGEKGINAVEEKLAELGHPFRFKEIRPLEWYPEALNVLIIATIKDIFNWTDSDIFEMGNFAPKYDFVVKLLMKYFLSPQKSFKEAGTYWRKQVDFGEMEATEFNEKEKYLVLRVKEYKFYPLICIYNKGYILRFGQYVIKGEKITIEETKCMSKGDPYHEYLIKWE